MEKVVTTAKLVLEHPEHGVFVVKRCLGDKRGGKLDLPGGELNPFEDPLYGVMREFHEEVAPLPDDLIVTSLVTDIRESSYGHMNLRFLVYALTEQSVKFNPSQEVPECTEGYFIPREFAALALGHCVQRQAVLGTLPMQRQSSEMIIPQQRGHLQLVS